MSLVTPPLHDADPVTHFALYERPSSDSKWKIKRAIKVDGKPDCTLRIPTLPGEPQTLMALAIFASGKFSAAMMINL